MKQHQLRQLIREILKEEKPGLWANIRAKRASGKSMAKKGSKAYKSAKKAGDKINKMEEQEETPLYDLKLPVDKKIVLQADTDEHKRGLVVTWLSDGGYDVAYWYDSPDNIVSAELKGDGESFGDITNVYLGFHPELGDKEDSEVDEGKTKVPHRKSGYMGYSEPIKEIEVKDNTGFKIKLKHLLQKHAINLKKGSSDTEFEFTLKHLLDKHTVKGGEIEENMSINEVLNMEIIDENITEAKYKGKTVQLNKPTRGDSKKFKVYVNSGKKNADGSIKVKKVNFGHGGTSAKKRGEKTMKIRKSNPKARAAFRARHRCDSPGPKTMARYWSCKKW